MDRRHVFPALVVLIAMCSAARGVDYYVAPDGNDANPGTEAGPWKTIQKAADTLVAGDTVHIKAGTYKERVIPQKSGSAGKYITYAAHPGHEVTIDGTGIPLPNWYGVFTVSKKSYLRISGLRAINSAFAGIFVGGASHIIIEKNHTSDTYSSGISVWNSSNITIDGNEVELACNDGNQECITVATTDAFEIKNNHVHHSGPGTRGGEGIDAKDGCSNGRIYKNHVHHINRLGIYLDAWKRREHDIDVFQNVVHDCKGGGIVVASEKGGLVEDIRVYNNIVHDNVVGLLVAGYGEPKHAPMKNIKMINNTVFRNGGAKGNGGGIAVWNNNATGVVIRSNICSQNVKFQITVNSQKNATVDHNLIDDFRGGWGETRGDDSVSGRPGFVDPPSLNFHLRENSPAVNRGSTVDAPSDDHAGTPRPQGAGYDIGAYESK